jgi:ribosomal protein L14E/L6E/L27E
LIGNIVFSRCGHDKGEIFIVVNQDESYYYLVDGKKRLINKPKKKKFKHVQITNFCCNEIVFKLHAKKCLDSDIRSAIKSYKERDKFVKG